MRLASIAPRLARVFDLAHHRRWVSLAAFLATCYIIGASYLGLNGGNTFRQADVYSQMLGFAGNKGYQPLDLFEFGHRAVFDIPIYQALIGTASRWARLDPLVLTRYANLACLALMAWSGYQLCLKLLTPVSAIVFVLLLTTSRLFEHYYAVPLPDDLSMALALYGVNRLVSDRADFLQVSVAGLALVIATLIKSPVPFVFLVFLIVYWIQSSASSPRTTRVQNLWPARVAVLLACLGAAVLAEQMRRWLLGTSGVGFAQDPSWYFGPLRLRLEPAFWDRMLGRLFSCSSQLFLPLMLVCILLARSPSQRAIGARKVIVAAWCGYFAGWLVFSNVYYIHDYYTMPAACMAMLGFAGVFAIVHDKYASTTDPRRGLLGQATLNAMLLLALLLAVVRLVYYPISDRSRASFPAAAEYALRNKPYFVYVRKSGYDPSLAGTMSTKYLQVTPEAAARDCVSLKAEHDAFLIESGHPCAPLLESNARSLLRAPGGLVLVIVR